MVFGMYTVKHTNVCASRNADLDATENTDGSTGII